MVIFCFFETQFSGKVNVKFHPVASDFLETYFIGEIYIYHVSGVFGAAGEILDNFLGNQKN